jgi:mRNA interferase MazF
MAVVVQSDWYALSSVIVAPTSTSALAASFRPEVTIGDHRTRVLCEQVVAIDVRRLQDFVGWLEDEHLAEVDAALTLILGLD